MSLRAFPTPDPAITHLKERSFLPCYPIFNTGTACLSEFTMAFLAAISWTLYVFSRENQLTLATLSDARRAILYGALGLIALLIAGSSKLFETGGGTLALILLFAGSLACAVVGSLRNAILLPSGENAGSWGSPLRVVNRFAGVPSSLERYKSN